MYFITRWESEAALSAIETLRVNMRGIISAYLNLYNQVTSLVH